MCTTNICKVLDLEELKNQQTFHMSRQFQRSRSISRSLLDKTHQLVVESLIKSDHK